MTAHALVERLAAQGIELWLDGDQLRYRAPKAALSPDLLKEIKNAKAEIVLALQAGQSAPFALTAGQRALWFLRLLEDQSVGACG